MIREKATEYSPSAICFAAICFRGPSVCAMMCSDH